MLTDGPIAWYAEDAVDESGDFPKQPRDRVYMVVSGGWTEMRSYAGLKRDEGSWIENRYERHGEAKPH